MEYEAMKKHMEPFELEDGEKTALVRINKLKGKNLNIARLLAGRDPKSGRQVDWEDLYYTPNSLKLQERRKLQWSMIEQLEQKKPGERIAIFNAVFGPIGEEVELLWQFLEERPFTTGYNRQAFRYPGNAEAYRMKRIQVLEGLLRDTDPYQKDIEFYLEHAAYIGWGNSEELALLFAAMINRGGKQGERVLAELVEVATSETRPGEMSHYVIMALLSCSRKEGWDAIQKLLLAAQRQEGLRQAILEKVDFAHPEAYVQFLRLILDEDLLRFSSAARAIDVWFQIEWDARSVKEFKRLVTLVLEFLEHPQHISKALNGKDAEQVYFALWSLAYVDTGNALQEGAKLMKHSSAAHRFAALTFLRQTQLDAALVYIYPLLEDEDIRVVSQAFSYICPGQGGRVQAREEIYPRLLALVERLSDKAAEQKAEEPMIWPWDARKLIRSEVADELPGYLPENETAAALIPYLKRMSPTGRGRMASLLHKEIRNPLCRAALMELSNDRSSDVSNQVFELVRQIQLEADEWIALEANLKRTSSNYRRGVIQLFASQKPEAALVSVDRLLQAKALPQRLAGLEVLSKIYTKKQVSEQVRDTARSLAQVYRATHAELSKDETVLLSLVEDQERVEHSLENALGLIDPKKRTLPRPMKNKKLPVLTKAAVHVIEALDALITDHADTELDVKLENMEDVSLFGEIPYSIPSPRAELSREENLKRLPLAGIWMEWWEHRPQTARDKDDGEVLRACACMNWSVRDKNVLGWEPSVLPGAEFKLSKGKLKNSGRVEDILEWLLYLFYQDEAYVQLALDIRESCCAQLAERHLCQDKPKLKQIEQVFGWESPNYQWWELCERFERWMELSQPLKTQSWDIAFWNWCPTRHDNKSKRTLSLNLEDRRPDFEAVIWAFQHELLSREDVIYYFIGRSAAARNKERRDERAAYGYTFETALQDCTRNSRWSRERIARAPGLDAIIHEICETVLDVELERGDLPTVASPIASCIKYVPGSRRFSQIARAVEGSKLARTYNWSEPAHSRSSVFSHLIKHCHPEPADTPEVFAKHMEQAGLPETFLVELALYVPRWASLIEGYLKWDGLQDAVLWYHAHTKEPGMEYQFQRVLSGESTEWDTDDMLWLKEITERTALGPQDLVDGAVDVQWFHSSHQCIGKARWKMIHDAAKFASSGVGHTRSKIFADAMLSKLDKSALVKRIQEKRHQDSVRALGLIPLEAGKKRDADILQRYEVMQEFLRGRKQFGSQRQASEKRAFEIGLANLARMAGYVDPIRFEWAMETQAVEDLSGSSISVEKEGVTVTLSINPWSEPEVAISRDGKALKSVPAKLKKDEDIKAITSRKTALKRQLSRMKHSLEHMMCRGDVVSSKELQGMFANPLLQHMLTQLLFVNEEGDLAGYPAKEGKVLIGVDGKAQAVGGKDHLRITHPDDLLQRGDWSEWQRECFAHERIQPFKQVFRELYPLTSQEKKTAGNETKRYAGHQVNPRQALALLGGCGWVNVPEEGVRKTYHDANISVWLSFEEAFYTPAEVEGLTLEGVHFCHRTDGKEIKLSDLPPKLFSEVMRDMDLVVSVAHMGGVDPEASQSTVEFRQQLAQETSRLLHLDNIRFKGNSMVIEGQLAKYSLHLGSAMTHKLPGGALFIVPVRSQHRGRIFLPFADNDPKTAELLSKMILLARDGEIKDPNILDQIRQ